MSSINLSGGVSSGASRPSHWTVKERLKSLTSTLSANSSLDLRFGERYFYRKDLTDSASELYSAFELMGTHSRTSSATYPNWDFRSGSVVGRLVEYSSDEARYGDLGVLDEGAATNLTVNPRFEGATEGEAGVDAVWPTNTGNLINEDNLIIRTGTENGWPYLEIEADNITPAGTFTMYLADEGEIAAVNGEDFVFSYGVRLVSGSLANVDGVSGRIQQRDASSALGTISGTTFSDVDDSHRRVFHQLSTDDASTVSIRHALRISDQGTGNWTFKLRFYAPQLERGTTPTSPVLPPVDTPGVSTRAADVFTKVNHDRASSGTYDSQWDFTDGGVTGTLTEFLPQVPRYGGLGLLAEPSTTNHVTNPRGEGATLGTDTLPTNWTVTDRGTTVTVEAVGSANGHPYVDIRFNGTPNNSPFINFEENGTIAASDGESWVATVGVQIVGGSLNNLTGLTGLISTGDSGAYSVNIAQDFEVDSSPRRFIHPITISDPNADSIFPRIRLDWDGSGDIDITLRIMAPQIENAEVPSSIVLPEPGTLAASTRARDDISFEADGWSGVSDEGTILYSVVPNTLISTTSNGTLGGFGVDNTDRLTVEVSSSNEVQARYRSGSNNDLIYTPGKIIAVGEEIRAVFSWSSSAFRLGINDSSGVVDGTPTNAMPTTSQVVFARPGAPLDYSVFIREFRYWPEYKTAEELATYL